ncbi:hypothetical protein [Vibrio campbellii]|uniref:hypothetical protein n=1 Tax=Vibrio campbellii TaxID=680 RepID=UPI0009E4A8F0|nr:hypothetical protein [Vibrio campbellii]ARR06077.1 hypothetical protein Vc3S01_1315 [Vibrio campbellii]EKO5224412.1 hypothetical protein [Vibrio parahaemolyticus]HDM8220427.1 hypothetical protein [Vibrio campbellii]
MADETKEISITPTLTSLFKPTGDYLGEELKNYVQSRVEKAKSSKQSENVQSHLESIRTKATQNDGHLTYHQLDLFEEWVEGASKVDPDDKLLSEMWQNLLLDSKNSFNSEIVLDKLKSISSGDAQTLIKVYFKKALNKEDRYRLNKLKSLELVEQNELKIEGVKLLLILCVGASGVSTFALSRLPPEVLTNMPYLVQTIVPYLPLLCAGLLGYVLIKGLISGKRTFFKVWQLTWLGERLVNLNK